MTTVIVLAGGSGTRLGAAIPKQFLLVKNKPILVYSLEAFQQHPMVDEIIVVCISGWENAVNAIANNYHIDKLTRVLRGGDSAIKSIAIGANSVVGSPDDIIVIHDGVRPLIEQKMITDAIEKAKLHGAAMSTTPLKEHIFVMDDRGFASSYLPRENSFRSSTPQAYRASILKNALQNGKTLKTAYASTLMVDSGIQLIPSYGSERNFKITTREDVALFSALLQAMEKDETEN